MSSVLLKAKFGETREISEESVLKMRVMVGDIDFYPELNNGRHLTMMDMGRLDLAMRMGLLRVVHEQGWGLAVGGASVRYRHRLKAFMRFHLHSRIVGMDDRWFYFRQDTIRGGRIHSSALVRTAITSREGIVAPRKVLEALGGAASEWDPGMPEWVKAWADAEELRPWDER
jgi:acyl-CoA thioesterase FadM